MQGPGTTWRYLELLEIPGSVLLINPNHTLLLQLPQVCFLMLKKRPSYRKRDQHKDFFYYTVCKININHHRT